MNRQRAATIFALVAVLALGMYLGRNGVMLVGDAEAQGGAKKAGPPPDNIVDGIMYPKGYTPVPIKNGKRVFL